jgi:hypothetical protein
MYTAARGGSWYIFTCNFQEELFCCNVTYYRLVDCVWYVIEHAQKPDFVFRAKRTSPFQSAGASVQSTTGSRGLRIRGSNAGYTKFRGSVKGTGYPLHSPISPSLPLPCVTVCHHISTGLYNKFWRQRLHEGTLMVCRHDLTVRASDSFAWAHTRKSFRCITRGFLNYDAAIVL